MRYNSYEQRVDKMVKAKKFVLRHLALIVCLTVLAVATVVCLCSVKGTVIEGDYPERFEYGQEFNSDTSAVFNSVTYQFKADGSDEWSSEVPKEVGTYKVRAVSSGLFGDVRYGDERTFVIEPKSLDVTIKEDTVVYGENPTLQADLAKGDTIECSEFEFADFTKEKTMVRPLSSALTVKNADGKDVTSSYKINIVEKRITFAKRTVEIVVSGGEETYFAGPYTLNKWEINQEKTPLAYNDTVSMTLNKSITDVGNIENTPENVRITNKAGKDVTNRYDVSFVVGELKINKRSLVIYPSGATKVYDGTPLDRAAYDKIEGDGLAEGDEIAEVTSLASVTDVAEGDVDNKISVKICSKSRKDKNGKPLDVTENYAITYVEDAKLTITTRPITITADSAGKVYDGTSLTCTTFTYTAYSEENANGLVRGEIDLEIVGSQLTVGEAVNAVREGSVQIHDGENDVTGNYDITLENGNLTVTKRPISIESKSATFVYNGKEQFCEDFEITSGNLAPRQTAKVASHTTIQNVGESGKENELVIKILDGEDDVTVNYDITLENGNLTVTKRPIKVKPKDQIKFYDGSPLRSCEVEVISVGKDGFMDLADGEGLTCDWFDSDFSDAISQEVAINTDLLDIRSNAKSVKDNYDIECASGIFEIKPRPIAVKPVDKTKVYDAETFVSTEIEVLEKRDFYPLVDGHILSSCGVMGKIVGVGNEEIQAYDVKICSSSRKDKNGKPLDVTDNYAINCETKGTLTITPRPITVTGESSQKVYDGEELSNEKFTYDGCNADNATGLLTEKGHEISISKWTKLVNAGEIDNKICVDIFVTCDDGSKENVKVNYEITYEYGKLTITKRPITVTADSDSKVYDGKPLTCNTFTYTSPADKADEGLVRGTINLEIVGSQLTAGESENVIKEGSVHIFDDEAHHFEEVTDNYAITLEKGKLTVTQRPITVNTATKSFVYNGKDQFCDEYEVTSELKVVEWQKAEVASHTTIQNVWESDKENKLVIEIKDGETDVTDNYKITYVYGTLTVTARPITVTANSDTKVYDGTPLTNSGVHADDFDEERGSGIVDGHKVKATVEGSITEHGVTPNVIKAGTVAITDASGNDVTANYDIATRNGTLTVTQRPITVKTATKSFVYNGEEQFCKDFEITSEYKVVEWQKAEVASHTTIQNVWESGKENDLVIEIKDGETVVTGNYKITYDYGTLTVMPRPIKIESVSAEKVYDDKPLYCSDIVYEQQSVGNVDRGLVTGQTATVDLLGISVTDYTPQAVKNEFKRDSLVIRDKDGHDVIDGHDVKDNYDVEFVEGTLTVKKRPIKVESIGESKTYDGTPLERFADFGYTKADDAENRSSGLLATHEIRVTDHASIVNYVEGGIKNKIIVSITVLRDGKTVDVTGNYYIEYEYGTLIINKRPISIESKSATFVYNGEEQFCDDFEITSELKVVEWQKAEVASHTTIQNVWESDKENKLVIKICDGEEDVTYNYAITYQNGKLTVTPRPIAVKLVDSSKVYDAQPFVTNKVEVLDEEGFYSLLTGHVVKIENVSTNNANADTYTVGFAADKATVFANGEDITANYAITARDGTLTIDKRKVTVTAGSARKVYDGTSLSCKDVIFEEQNGDRGIVSGQDASAQVVEYSVTDWSSDTRYNTVLQSSFAVYSSDDKENVTQNYEPNFVDGTLTIDKRPLTITARSDSKVYDGEPLINDKYDVEKQSDGRGLLANYSISGIATKGEITNVGDAANIVEGELVIKDEDGNDVTFNFDVEFVEGILTVKQRPITVIGGGGQKVYDGEVLFNKTFTYDGCNADNTAGLLTEKRHEISISNWTELVNVCTDVDNEICVDIFVTRDDGIKEDVTGNYDIKYEYGKFTITKRPISIESKSATFVYNGKDQFCDEYEVTSELKVVERQRAIVASHATVRNVWDGEVSNILEIAIYDGYDNVTDNYDISYPTYGTLSVTKRKIVVTANSDTKVYDGTPLVCSGVHADDFDEERGTGIVADHTIFANVKSGEDGIGITNVGSVFAKIIDSVCVQDFAGADVTDNYEIVSLEDGVLTITRRKVTIRTSSGEFLYDGKEHSLPEYSVISDLGIVENQRVTIGDYIAIRNVWESVSGNNVFAITDIIATLGDGSEESVIDNYDISYEYGTLLIIPRSITITSGSAEKVYDDEPLYCDKISHDSGLVDGQKLEVKLANVSVTNYTREPFYNSIDRGSLVIYDESGQSVIDGHDVKENYIVTFDEGTLTVTQRPITIESFDDSKMYDGKALENGAFSYTSFSEQPPQGLLTVKGHKISASKLAQLVNAGEIDNEICVDIVATRDDGSKENVTDNYAITYVYGKLKVTPRPIAVKIVDASKVYDAQPFVTNKVEVLEKEGFCSLLDGHVVEIEEVRTDSANAGVYTVGFAADKAKVYANGEDITANYAITPIEGTLTIGKRTVTVTPNNDTKVYDGTPLVCSGVHADAFDEERGTGIVDGHEVKANVTSEGITNVGSVDVTIDKNSVVITVLRDGKTVDVTGNYEVKTQNGTITVTQRPITITARGAEKVYDGEPLINEKYNVEGQSDGRGLLDGHEVSGISTKGEITDAGRIKNAFVGTLVIKDKADKDVKGNYLVELKGEDLVVKKRSITVTGDGGHKVYDGTPLENDTFSYTPFSEQPPQGLLTEKGHEISISKWTKLVNVCTDADNVIEVVIMSGENDVTGNYEITYEYGKFTITKRPISIKTGSATFVYNGKDQFCDEYEITSGDIVGGQTHRVTKHATIRNVAESGKENALTIGIFATAANGNEEEVTRNYDITYQNGTLSVTKLAISVKAENRTKVYDAKPFASTFVEITDGALCEGHKFDCDPMGDKFVNVGTQTVTINKEKLRILDENDKNATDNYTITITGDGTLTITKRPITIIAKSAQKYYDGKPLKANSFIYTEYDDVNNVGLIPWHKIEATVEGERTEEGSSDNIVTACAIYDKNTGYEVTGNYDVTLKDGLLTVSKEGEGKPGELDDDGTIGGGGGNEGSGGSTETEPTVMLSVKSSISDRIYLKLKSYGDFNGKSWGNATAYPDPLTDDGYGFDYLTGSVLSSAGYELNDVSIRSSISQYLLPYYMAMADGDYQKQISDVAYVGDPFANYSLKYFNASSSDVIALKGKGNRVYDAEEESYRSWVEGNYLKVPDDMADFLDNIIKQNGFKKDSIGVYEQVAAYIKGAAKYNLKYDTGLDRSDNIVIAFLRDYKEGICSHFASAATLLFRQLGIPARYSKGLVGTTEKDKWVDITSQNAHAWVEVYVDGIGWVQIEVTPGSGGSGSGDGGGSGSGGSGGIGGNWEEKIPEGERVLTITPVTVSKPYDGTPLNAKNEIEQTEIVSLLVNLGFRYAVTVKGSRTEVGTGSSTIEEFILYDPNGKNVTDMFTIEKKEGKIIVYEESITIDIGDLEKVYDAKAFDIGKYKDDFTVTIPTNRNYTVEFKIGTTEPLVNAGEYSSDKFRFKSCTVYDENHKEVDGILVTIKGSLTIKQRAVKVSSSDKQKVYDGEPLNDENGGIEVEQFNLLTSRGLVEGHLLSAKLTASITNAGSTPNAIEIIKVVDESGADVTSNYSFEVEAGELKVIPRVVYVNTGSGSKYYDGEPLTNGYYTIVPPDPSTSSGLLDGHKFASITLNGSQTEAGNSHNTIGSYEIVDQYGNPVTDNYTIGGDFGILEVLQRRITIRTSDASKVYDDESLTRNEYTVIDDGDEEGTGLLDGHSFDYIEVIGSITDAGWTSNSIDIETVRIVDAKGRDVTGNYAISVIEGTLTVTKRPITVKSESATKVYDGTPLTKTDGVWFEQSGDGRDGRGLLKGHSFSYKLEASVINVGTITNEITDIVITSGGRDVTENYEINGIYGELTITPRPITVTTNSAEKIYDGTSLSDDWYTYEGFNKDRNRGLLAEHELFATVSTSITNAGETINRITYIAIIDKDGTDVTRNYAIEREEGMLHILPRPIKLTSGSSEKVYDDTLLFDKRYMYEHFDAENNRGLLEGHLLSAELNVSLKYVDCVYNEITNIVVTADGKDVTRNYSFELECGTLTITPRPITITSNSAKKVYDGTPLSDNGFDYERFDKNGNRGLVDGHNIFVTINASLTDADSIANDIVALSIEDADGNIMTGNYDITTICGQLTVLPREFTIRTFGAQKYYDGTPLTRGGYDIVFNGNADSLVSGHNISEIQVTGSQTDAGYSYNTVNSDAIKVFDEYGEDVTRNYKIWYDLGTLTVDKRHIQINPLGATKVYDGTLLVNPDNAYTISDCGFGKDGGLAPNQRIERVWFDGERIEVGTSETTLNYDSLIIVDENGNNVTFNYEVSSDPGELTITPRKIQIIVDDASKEYDGKPLVPSQDGYTIGDDGSGDCGLAPGQNIGGIQIGGSQLLPGQSSTEVAEGSVIITDGSGADVSGNYEIEIVEGTLTVEKKSGLDTSGDLGGGNQAKPGDGDSNIEVVLRVKSGTSDSIYLKIKSFGDYTGKGWTNALEYDKTLTESFGFDYLTGSALKKAGIEDFGIEIKSESMQYFLPYYLSMANGNYDIQSNDTMYSGNTEEIYSLRYYTAFVSQLARLKDSCAYTEQEAAYRKFVYENYLEVPDSTKKFLQKLINDNKLASSSENIYETVATFIQNAAEYALDYDAAMDEEDDIVVAFLDKYKKGVCRHYAAAATLMFRTLGIPARYSIGYVGQTEADEWVNITNQQGHAWVEVYIDGIGWAQVEVTGGGPGSGNGNGNGSGFNGSGNLGDGSGSGGESGGSGSGGDIGGGDDDPQEITLDITPLRIGKKYDGTPIYAQNKIKRNAALNKLLARGYSYRVTVTGSQTDIGVGISTVTEFILLDPNGNNVTEGCGINVVLHDGEIVVAKNHASIELDELKKPYDGTPLEYGEDDYEFVDLPDGYDIEFTLESISDAGVYRAEYIEILSYKVYDADGNDVTADFYIDTIGEGITISKRVIEIVAGSATKVYDGTPLENDSYRISRGTLIEGDEIRLTIKGSITSPGSVDNEINKNVRIIDSEGNNVTDNYQIIGIWGKLTVTQSKK